MRDELRVAVVGGGIGGLTVAAGLVQAGIRCTVYEQAPRLAEVGAGLQLAPNAVRHLRRLGLGEPLDGFAVRPEAIEMARWDDGRLIMRMPLGARCEQEFGAPYCTVHRAHLHAALADRLDPETVRLGRRLVAVAERPDGVTLRFADGGTATADVVVGADGIRSVLRAELADDAPVFSGQTVYRALIPADRLGGFAAPPRVRLWLGAGQHLVAYPVAAGRLVSLAATAPAGDGWRTESWVAAGSPAELAAAYRDWHPDVQALIRAAAAVTRWGLHDRSTIGRWSTDRITLVGDAAHPMLPFLAQGANQAIEDAAALVACLTATGEPPGAALRRYERLRVPRTAEVHRRSRANASTLHLADGDAQLRRDEQLVAEADVRAQAWLYGYDAAAAVHN